MRGKARLLAVCALAGALAVPLGAAAETAADSAYEDRMGRHAERHRERLRLDCRALGRDGVGCQWSPSKSRDFAGYRLVRMSRQEAPAIVFATGDRRHTKALDDTVARDRDYLYVVEAVDAAGETIARSNPARVRTGGRHDRPAPAPPAVPSL